MRTRFIKVKKYIFCLIVFFVFISFCMGMIYAWLRWNDSVINEFHLAESVNPIINETFSDNVKSNVFVSIGETKYPVYVRASIVVNWQDSDGNILAFVPTFNHDYTLELGNDWFESGGFYYYKYIVDSGKQTTNLIDKCEQVNASPEKEYNLNVKIVVQTIQAIGTTDENNISAVEDAWNVKVNDNGTLSKN